MCARPGCEARIVHIHHVLPEQQWPELAQEEDNLLGLCFDCHMAEEFSPAPDARLPRGCLPAGVWRLARERCSPPADWYIERRYPAAGGSR